MNMFELNKVFGALVGAGAVFLGMTILVEKIYHKDHHDYVAFAAAPDEAPTPPTPVVEEPLSVLLASADIGKGERVFRKCAGCHNADEGGANGVGPNLWAVMGREIGGVAGYDYSSALADHGGVWDWEAMNGFLTAPKDWAPGTKMNYAGLPKGADRAHLMAYLNAQSAAPLDPPAE